MHIAIANSISLGLCGWRGLLRGLPAQIFWNFHAALGAIHASEFVKQVAALAARFVALNMNGQFAMWARAVTQGQLDHICAARAIHTDFHAL